MSDQAKMQRLLRLLMLLAGRRRYNAADIEARLHIGKRSLYRYLNTLDEAGFVVERHTDGYRLAQEHRKQVNGLLHFTPDEADTLYQTLQQVSGGGETVQRLINKLHLLYDCHLISQAEQQHHIAIAAGLREAIASQVQCVLQGYASNHSGTVADRLVEPFEFSEDGERVWCYEPSSGRNKQFKLQRIKKVQPTTNPWQFTPWHEALFADAFGFSAPKPIGQVSAMLSLRAANLLKEEHAPTIEHLTPLPNQRYHLYLPVASWKGIGRFVRGLADDIEVLGPDDFKNFLGQ